MTANLDPREAAVAADPNEERAFAELEEACFAAADWEKLLALYRTRLDDPRLQDPRQRAPLHFRLGQILEERCLEIDRAIEEYTRAIRLDPSFRPAMRQLRQVHMGREAWDVVLQIAEVEIGFLTAPYDRAAFFAEMGAVWQKHIGDTGEALSCFQQALSIDAQQKDALAGLARTLEAQGKVEAAAATWERLIGCLRGPDRAAPQVALASLLAGPLHQGERAVELYRRALSDDPRNENAVEALSVTAAARGQWELLSDLYERRFRLAAGARRRTAIALEAGYMHLEQRGNEEAARIWFERARELSGDDLAVLKACADLERQAGNDEALLRALERVAELSPHTPVRLLVEAAALRSDRSEDEQALVHLERAQAKSPDDPAVLEALAGSYASLQRHEELVSVLERRASLAEDDPETRAAALVEVGQVHARHLGDDEAAQDAFERAFDARPGEPGIASTLEGLYRKTESWQPLRAMLERARREGPERERSGFHCSLGELLEEHFDDPATSAACFEASLDLAPSPRALQGLSRLARASGDGDAMIRALEREASMTSEGPRLAEVSDELRQRYEDRNDLEKAAGWAERALASSPDRCELLERMASLQERLDRTDALEQTLERLDDLLVGPERASARRRLAILHEKRGDAEAAVGYWQSALEWDAGDVASLSALRVHYAEQARAEELAPVLRKLADLVPDDQRAGVLDELCSVLDEQLCDLDGAIVVLWRLSSTPGRPANVGTRLESLLERAGRFEELAQQLAESRRGLPDDSDDAIEIDLRRAQLLLDPLGQFEEAVNAFRAVRLQAPDREEATVGLERALRAANDSAGLCRLLAEMAEQTDDGRRREQLLFERAVLLEESLGELEQARQAYATLCQAGTGAAMLTQATVRLERLLERCGDWQTLRQMLETAIEASDPRQKLALHERVASLCADRMDDPEGCIRHLEAAARLDPQRPEPWRKLAGLYKRLEQQGDLLRVTEAELETGPDTDRERVLRARAAALWLQRPEESERACGHYERLLELEPGRSDASEFLIERYEGQDRYEDVVRLLEGRLRAVTPSDGAPGADPNQGLQISLRLRIAELRAEELGDPAGAIDALEPAFRMAGAGGPATEPLAELYQLTRRNGDLIELCELASRACAPSERATWLLRLAACLAEEGEEIGAAAAYREVLEVRPGDPQAYAALCDVYRRSEQAEPLAELLESALPRVWGEEETALRMELARLLEEKLDRPDEALVQLQRVIEIEGHHDAAFAQALRIAERLGQHDREIELVDSRLEQRPSPEERGDLLERRARLLAGPLDAPENAVSTLRELIGLDPERRSARRALRETLERLGRWTAVLDCLYVDAHGADDEERVAIYEHAVEVATAQVGPDSALPWLERLRSARPRDPLVIARIADVHRLAGRFEAVLRALEDELEVTNDLERKRDLHVGRARILERDMHSPGRAVAALEVARSLAPDDPEILRKLDELYALTGRARERVDVIEARIAGEAADAAGDAARLQLHLAAAQLYSETLVDPARAVPHLLRAAYLTEVSGEGGPRRGDGGPVSTPEARGALLADLADTLRATGREEASARAREAELSVLLADLQERPASPGSRDPREARRVRLHFDLAWLYAESLANPTSALHHMRIALARSAGEDGGALSSQETGRLESAFLDLLRRDANWIELADGLATRLARGPGSADEWLELARLLDERLHATATALDAYAQALALRPTSRTALRGLRDVAERLGNWPEVVRSLELELGLREVSASEERAALARRMGSICWQRLEDRDRAADAYAKAVEAAPSDLESLRALQELRRLQERWSEAMDLLEREAEVLGDRDRPRRKHVWLSLARLAHRHADDRARAISAYERAASVAPLEPDDTHALAGLYRASGALDRYAACYADWCDDPRSAATCAEHLALVETLVELGRPDDALERARTATRADAHSAPAWATLAELLEERGDLVESGSAWQRAGELRHGPAAADHLTHAALLVESSDPQESARRLRGAVKMDPGCPAAHAHLARVALALDADPSEGRAAEAETAAARALDLAAAGDGDDLPDALQLETALLGGLAARRQDRLEAAVLFYGVALDLEPRHEQALEAYGELLFERGDLAAARGALEARLEGGPDERRAERLSMLGSVLELAGESDAALDRFREAVACDRTWGAGHAGVARLAEKAGRIDEAVAALEGWAASAEADGSCDEAGTRLLRAAELELEHDRVEPAQRLLRRALELSPERPRAWVLLVEILAESGAVDALLEVAPDALGQDCVRQMPDAVARIALLHARALEERQSPDAACEAYGEAAAHDGRCAEAVLARARLLRARGDWRAAADALQRFCDEHPEPDHRDLAEAHYKLASLLAGPLEDLDASVRQFERALEIAPDHPRAREPLARMLSVLPERWKEAVRHHGILLAEDPTRSASIRALQQIARGRGDDDRSRFGLAVLRAMGAASPGEREEAPDFLPRAIVESPQLDEPVADTARRLLEHASEALDELLGTTPPPAGQPATLSSASFEERLAAAERELCAAGLERFSDAELGDLVCTIAALSLGEDAGGPAPETGLDPGFARDLERALGRWTRRKIRRGLDPDALERLRELDFTAWRVSMRGLAAALAVDTGQGDLRAAFGVLCAREGEPGPASDGEDWTTRIQAEPVATELLRRVTAEWAAELART